MLAILQETAQRAESPTKLEAAQRAESPTKLERAQRALQYQ